MKKLALSLIFLMSMFSCKGNTAKASSQNNTTKTEVKEASAKISDFECDAFFKKGDYSSVCFTDAKLPEYNGRGCIFAFVTKGDKQEQSIKVQFDPKGSSSLAEMSLNLYKNNYKKGEVTEVANIGDAAFFDVHRTDLKSLSRSNKDLHVRYKNITFKILAEYQSNKEVPCFYDDKHLIIFAKTIIKNL